MSYKKVIDGTLKEVNDSQDVMTITDNTTLDASNTGTFVLIATDAKVITLGTTLVGNEFTIVNTGTNGNNIVAISPTIAESIVGTTRRRQGTTADATTAAGIVCVSGAVAGKDLINTKATAIKYDFVKIKKITATEWLIVDGVGIWISES